MKLKSFGCSFVWGSEMPDCSTTARVPSQTTWPALLSRKLGIQYECHAHPGCGNLQIAEQILNQLTLKEPAFFVVNWTYIDRFDYSSPKTDCWSTLRPSGSDQLELAEYYYRNLHSQYRDKLTTLIHIKTCVDALQQAGHEFRMTYMDDLIMETAWHTSPAVLHLQESIQPHLRQFDNSNMLQYSRDRGHVTSPQSHPLELAHQDLFEYALANFAVDKIKTT